MTKNQKFISKSAKNTQKIGEEIGKTLCGGDILLLTGELGAGKTTLTKGLALALGVSETVISPTFCLHNSFSGTHLTLNHFDFFRIIDSEEVAVLGLDELFFDKSGVCVIEWWQNAVDLIPAKNAKIVDIKKLDDDTRQIEIFDYINENTNN